MRTLDEFSDFFKNTMMKDLVNLESRRKKIVKFSLLSTLIAVGGILITIATSILICSSDDCYLYYNIIGSVLFIVVGIIFYFVKGRDKTFYTDFKKQVVNSIVTFVSPELTYNAKNFIGLDTFERSRIFLTRADRYRGDDMVEGKIDKTQIWFSEVHAEYKQTTTDSKGRTKTTWHRIFKGLFFVADFNKHFSTSTVVLPNRLGRGSFARFFQKLNLARKEKLVNLEDPDFNKFFVVYGEDQIEARYVLSTSLMKRITEFKKKHKNSLYISFVNSFLYIAVSYKRNLFEPSYFKKLTRLNIVKEYFEDIQLAVGIVEELNLNNRIWTKQ
ncbi:MAG: DUF3137 domain-containing protein [Bacteroidales bacterium]